MYKCRQAGGSVSIVLIGLAFVAGAVIMAIGKYNNNENTPGTNRPTEKYYFGLQIHHIGQGTRWPNVAFGS